MKKKWSKQLLAVVLSAMLIVGQASFSAFAEEDPAGSSESSTSETSNLNNADQGSENQGQTGESAQNSGSGDPAGDQNQTDGNETNGNDQDQTDGNEINGNDQNQNSGNETNGNDQNQNSGNSDPSGDQDQTGGNDANGNDQDQTGGNSGPAGDQDQTAGNETNGNDQDQTGGNADQNKPEENKTVVASLALVDSASAEKTVPVGTAKDKLELPKTVKVTVKVPKLDETGSTVIGESGEPAFDEVEKELEVTWECAEYKADVAGAYTFTAKLPEGYVLAEGAALPTVKVTVGSKDFMVYIESTVELITAPQTGISTFSLNDPNSFRSSFSDQLSDYSAVWYQELLKQINSGLRNTAKFEMEIKSKTALDNEEIAEQEVQVAMGAFGDAFSALDRDHPEIFWLGSGQKIGVGTRRDPIKGDIIYLEMTPEIIFNSTAEISSLESQINSKISSIKNSMPSGLTVYNQLKYFHDWLVDNNKYNSSVSGGNSDTAPKTAWKCVSGFLSNNNAENGPVCEGYARAFKMLCETINVPCILVSGTGNGGAHMWNYVQLDGKWYAVDTTWDDPVSSSGGDIKRYDYFLVGKDVMEPSHVNSGIFNTRGSEFAYPSLESVKYDPNTAATVAITSVTPDKTDWTKDNVTVTISATGTDNSAVSNVKYQVSEDNSNTWNLIIPNSNTYTISTEGEKDYSFRIKYTEGGKEKFSNTESVTVKIDKTAPTAAPKITNDTEYTADKWHNTEQKVAATFTQTPNASPEKLQYSTDNGKTWTDCPTDGVPVSAEGTTTVSFQVIDEVGFEGPETVPPATVQIDKTKPVIGTITATPTTDPLDNPNPAIALYNIITNKKVTVTATVTDAGGSGIKEVQYKFGAAGDWMNAPTPATGSDYTVTIDSSFTGKVSFKATDKAGNESEPKDSDDITAENTKPTITIASEANKWYKAGDKISVTVQDSSGIDKVTYQFNGQTAQNATGTGDKFEVTVPDSVTGEKIILTVTAIDKAGNQKTATANVKIDNQKPTVSAAATTINAATSTETSYTYNADKPSELDVKFTLSNTNTNPSSTTYQYATADVTVTTAPTSGWTEIKGTTHTVSENGKKAYFFKAVSGAGLESDPTVANPVNILKPVPTPVTVQATGPVGKWTKEDIKFDLSGGFQDDSILKGYQVTTTATSAVPSGSETWTDVTGTTYTASEEKDQYYWFRAVSNGGSTGGISVGQHVMIDKKAPIVTDFAASDLTDSSAKITFQSDEAGTYYYVNQNSGGTAPDAAAVKTKGTKGTAKSGENSFTINNLDAFTNYETYIVVEDAAGNLSAVLNGTYKTTKLNLTVTITSKDREYDGTREAKDLVTATLSGVKAGHTVTAKVSNAVFSSKDAGIRTVTVAQSDIVLEGADADKYAWPPADSKDLTTTATITPKALTLNTASVKVKDKPFDGTVNGVVDGTIAFTGAVNNEVLTYSAGAKFSDANVGTAKAVTVTVKLTGSASANYTLDTAAVSVQAAITKASGLTASYAGKLNMKEKAEKEYTFDLAGIALNKSNYGTISYTAAAPSNAALFKAAPTVNGTKLSYTSADTASNGETATVVVTVSTQNYADTTVTLNFAVVEKDVVTITGITVVGSGKTYDGKAVSYTGSVPGYTGKLDYVWSTAAATALSEAPENAGDYLLTVSIPDTETSMGSAVIPFSIQKAPLKLIAADYTCYEETAISAVPKTYRYIGFVNGETAGEVFGSSAPTVALGVSGSLTVGSYPITFTTVPTDPTNYQVTTQNGTLIVKQLEENKVVKQDPITAPDGTEIKIVKEKVTETQKEIVEDAIATEAKVEFADIPVGNVEVMDLVPINSDTNETVDLGKLLKGQEITITIPYPSGTNQNDIFVVLHLKDGVTPEILKHKNTTNGLECTVTSLSPFAVGYKKAPTPTPPPTPDDGDNNNNGGGIINGGGSSGGGSNSSKDKNNSSSASNKANDTASISAAEKKFWNTVESQLKKADDGDTINVNAKSYDRIPVSVLKAIKGKDITLNIKWNGGDDISINGMDVVTPEATRRYYPITKLLELYQDVPTKKTTKKKAGTVPGDQNDAIQTDDTSAGTNGTTGNAGGTGGTGSYVADDGTTVKTKENPNTGLIIDIDAPGSADITNAPITPAENGLAESSAQESGTLNIGFLIAAIAAVAAAGGILFFSLKKIKR